MIATREQTVKQGMERAIAFLLFSQDGRGCWTDFFLPAGASDIWVTGYVGAVLAGQDNPHARKAAERAWTMLSQSSPDREGWGYHEGVPSDADSTLWVLQLARTLGREGEAAARRGFGFLRRHVQPDGGLTTYEQEAPIRNYIHIAPGLISFNGWCHSHLCVTAAAASLGEWRERLTPHLLSRQQPDGSWPSYWWFEDEYCTALALEAVGEPERWQRAVNWGRDRLLYQLQSPQPSEFAIAWCLQILSRDDAPATRAAIGRGVQFLLERQRSDGSWPPSAQLRVPRPDCLNPRSVRDWKLWTGKFTGSVTLKTVLESTFNIYSLDHKGIFTTATVVRALQSVTAHGNPSEKQEVSS